MIQWLLAAGLLASGQYHNAKGYSGTAQIDFGRVIPGHSYYYQAFFRNDAGVPLKISSASGCGECPHVLSAKSRLAPGDSTYLQFTGSLGKGIKDSLWRDVFLYTDDGSLRGLWIYRVKLRASRSHLFSTQMKPVEVNPNAEGYLEGTVTLVSKAKKRLTVMTVGMPHGVQYRPAVPLSLDPGSSRKLVFWAPPEFFTRHRSITLEAVPEGGGSPERISLPFAP